MSTGSRWRSRAVHLAVVVAVLTLALPASAGAYVYWANLNANTIGRANLDGDSANQAFITGVSLPVAVAVDGQHVYWAAHGTNSIGRANLDGTAADQNFIIGPEDPRGLALDGQHIYWTNFGPNSAGTTIGRANLDGTGVDESFITGATEPYGVAVDGQHVYWTNMGGLGTMIGRANLNGTGADQSFITGAASPAGIAVDAQHVYWANFSFGTNTIGRANLDGNPASVDQSFITGANSPVGVAVDGQHVYWANFGNTNGSTIGRANLDGTAADESFIAGASGSIWVAVDSLPNASSTVVGCAPAAVTLAAPAMCTATVTDTGFGSSPAGTVAFSSSGPGVFSPAPSCSLAATSSTQSACSVNYTASAVGNRSISAAYSGDVRHAASSGATALDVTTPPPPPPPSGVPALSTLQVSPQTFTLTGRLVKRHCQALTGSNLNHPSCTRPIALNVSYTLSSAASVTFTIERTVPGRLVKGHCKAPTRANRRHQRCTRIGAPATLKRVGTAGANGFLLPGRIGRLKLTAGSYRLLATPTAGGRTGKQQRVTFRIAR